MLTKAHAITNPSTVAGRQDGIYSFLRFQLAGSIILAVYSPADIDIKTGYPPRGTRESSEQYDVASQGAGRAARKMHKL